MARSVVIVDDIDCSSQAETIEFSYKGTRYEIDLGSKNQQKFDSALAEYIGHARKVGGTSTGRVSRGGGQRAKRDPEQLDAIRRWLREQGHEVSDRGRIKAELEELYNQAHK